MELEQDVIKGLNKYKQALLDMSADTTSVVCPEEVRRCLASEGVMTNSPVAVIPYAIESLRQAGNATQSTEWHDPFTSGRIEDAKAKRLRLDAGESIYDVGFPTVFYSSLLDVAVVIDDYHNNAELFGKIFARGLFIDSFAHEFAHSAFAQLTRAEFEDAGNSHLKVKTISGIGQVVEEFALWPNGGTENEYNPTWIDEAFASYTAAKVRAKLHPDGTPKKPHVMSYEEFGCEEIEIPPQYLIFSEEYPDEPGDSGGSVAALGLEALEAKRPGLTEQIRSLTAGKLAVGSFHAALRNKVGSDLYTTITERRPYNMWGAVLAQIEELA